MVDLVVDPRLVVVHSVVLHCLPGVVGPEAIDHLDFGEVDDDTALGSAWNVRHGICLNCHLHGIVSGYCGHFCVPTRFANTLKEGSSSEVHANVTFRDLVDAIHRKGDNDH